MLKFGSEHSQDGADAFLWVLAVAISTEDGALGKGTDFACFCLMNAAQVPGTAAQLVGLHMKCFSLIK